MLIINEKKYVEDILSNKESALNISDTYLIRLLLRYFANEYQGTELINHVQNLCKGLNIRYYKEHIFYEKIKKIAKEESKNPTSLREKDYIYLSSKELEVIKKCEKNREKKIMFVCYIVARLNNSDWINVDDKVLFKMANITLSCKERQLVLFQMIKKGYLGQAKKNTNNSLKIEGVGGEEVLRVNTLENLGNFIFCYLNPNYIQCCVCGRSVKIKSQNDGSAKYCKNCAILKKAEQKAEWKRKNRRNGEKGSSTEKH